MARLWRGYAGCWRSQERVRVLGVFMFGNALSLCSERLAQITSALCRVVAACIGGGVRPQLMAAPMIVLVWRRVKRVEVALLILMARVVAGRVPVVRPRAVCGDVVEVLPGAVDRAAVGDFVPRRSGWLVEVVGYEAAACRSQLEHLLSEPEMAALVRDVPQARRLLAPLCRMLGVVLDGVAGSGSACGGCGSGVVAAGGVCGFGEVAGWGGGASETAAVGLRGFCEAGWSPPYG
eukprot:gene11510-11606_t